MAKQLTGTVVSVGMQKAVVVAVSFSFRHHLYKKIIHRSKRYKAHHPVETKLVVGDRVIIGKTRPQSKDIHFRVLKKVN